MSLAVRRTRLSPALRRIASRRAVLERTQPDLFTLHLRAYSVWPEEEDRNLTTLVSLGASIEDIAALHGRKPGSIKSRLAKLELD
jgi:hypothetical protein